MIKHQVKNESGQPIEFQKHRFLYDVYNDLSPRQVMLKAPQVGATTMNIVKTFWVAKKLQRDIIYTLPTQSDVQDMAGGKVNRVVAQNPVIASWVRDHDSVEQKAVGSNIVYYRGTFSAKQAMMVSSRLNAHDEVDASDAAVITQYETRLQAEEGGWTWLWSHPSLAGFGVDIYWQQSDKKEWFVKCASCGSCSPLEWPGSVSRELGQYVCRECGAAISDLQRQGGQWRDREGRPWKGKVLTGDRFSGWHVSQLICPWISAKAILEAYDDPNKGEQYFWNYVLGLPFVGSENKIMPEVVLKNVDSRVNSQGPTVVIGVDTGLPVHYVLMNPEGAFFAAKRTPEQRPYEELGRLLDRFDRSMLVADQGGDLIGVRQLQARFPGRVFLCHYRRDRKSQSIIKWGSDQEAGSVVVDRNRMIQLVVEQLRDPGRIRLNGTKDDWRELAVHFGNMHRVAKETSFGVEHSWERSGPDHFAHALVYAMVGLDRFSEQEAKILGPDVLDGLPTGRLFAE